MGSFNWHKKAEYQWDKRASFWNERSKDMWENGSRKDIIPFIKRHIPKKDFILDIGCGDGFGSYQLYKAGYRVTGVDLSSEMIGRAKRYVQQGNDMSFIQGDITKLPFSDNQFDGIMAINVLEWTANPLEAILELKRVMKRKAFLCVGILGPTAGPRQNSYDRLYGDEAICNTMMPWEFEQLASENGFTIKDGFGVYKKGVNKNEVKNLSIPLQQALTFMWVFMLRKESE
ncbi:class I SAM-dependent methyltransferase [Oceanobacillus halotolerans]|uniref:class I SAM-dependent methyltransferase n=1 Tax=Oceanobacillus halotolerans TaxID=2663380 RepID=UPI0013D8E67D|nr:class I SAM-dependent methyltransferase [Oceanobacillus halotolerans]